MDKIYCRKSAVKAAGGLKAESEKSYLARQEKLLNAHIKEVEKKNKADFFNLGWVTGDDEIASKTTIGRIESKINPKTGKVTHKWDFEQQ